MKTKKRFVKINALTQAQLIRLLLEGTHSCAELAEETGLHYVTVLHYTRELHRAGAAHICMWEKDTRGRDLVKIYKLGKGADAKREKLTVAERQARSRQKKRAIELATIWR
jgi:predicted ArsR family transcriptional regulator